MLNLAAVSLPATRTSLWQTLILGVSFERALHAHRMLGALTLFSLVAHGVLMAAGWGSCVLGTDSNNHPPLYGFVSGLLFLVLGLTALPVVRRRWFDVFRLTHFIFIPALFAAFLHAKLLGVFGFPALMLYIYDRIRRRRCTKSITVTSAAWFEKQRVTRIGVASGITCEPGQYLFVRVPNVAWTEWHPVSISSVDDNCNAATLHVRATGTGSSWSSRVGAAARDGMLTVLDVEGPYGHPALDVRSFGEIVVVAGGIGVTPLLCMVQRQCDLARTGAAAMPKVTFVWSVRDVGLVNAFEEELRHLLDVTVAVHVTSGDVELMNPNVAGRPGLLNVRRGRTDVAALLRTCDTSKTGVFVCGPPGLVDVVHREAAERGLPVHAESFLF